MSGTWGWTSKERTLGLGGGIRALDGSTAPATFLKVPQAGVVEDVERVGREEVSQTRMFAEDRRLCIFDLDCVPSSSSRTPPPPSLYILVIPPSPLAIPRAAQEEPLGDGYTGSPPPPPPDSPDMPSQPSNGTTWRMCDDESHGPSLKAAAPPQRSTIRGEGVCLAEMLKKIHVQVLRCADWQRSCHPTPSKRRTPARGLWAPHPARPITVPTTGIGIWNRGVVASFVVCNSKKGHVDSTRPAHYRGFLLLVAQSSLAGHTPICRSELNFFTR